ncbi:MAG: hypothetical protein AAGC60_11330 [Acidobacteriota bacterium]
MDPSTQPTSPPANPYAPPAAPSNPYAPPSVSMEGAPRGVSHSQAEAEAIRREHVRHEASVRSIGLLYYLNGLATGLYSVIFLFAALGALVDGGEVAMAAVMGGMALFAGAFSAFVFWLGSSLRKLEERSRVPATVLAAIGLIGIPIGTLISAYILYLLHSEKGKRIFTAEYRAIRDRTPEIRYRTSLAVWLVLGALVLGFIGLIVWAMNS